MRILLMTWTVPGLYRYGAKRDIALDLQAPVVAGLVKVLCRASKGFLAFKKVVAHHGQSPLCRICTKAVMSIVLDGLRGTKTGHHCTNHRFPRPIRLADVESSLMARRTTGHADRSAELAFHHAGT
jgi:hypothetical protein